MTAADDAYTAAQALIAQAKAEGATKLLLNTPETRVLNRLPPELADLEGLETLLLNNTLIDDITFVAALKGLRRLSLDNTPTADLTPLSALTGLRVFGLEGTLVRDLAPLTNLTGLRNLFLRNTPIIDFLPLAKLPELQTLSLSKTKMADLHPLSQLSKLNALFLENTEISDLSPLANLTRLNALFLSNTLAHDLRPLRRISSLVDRPLSRGLTFQNTPATRADPRIAEIAEITDAATRARELFAYLETWVPPADGTVPPEPDPLFRTILIDDQLELAPDPPTQAERDEALKKALHIRLQSTAPELARAAGNLFPRLASKARVLAVLVEKPFDELDLVAVHLEVETLHDRLQRGTEDGIAFPDDVLGPLSDVTRTGPGLTLGHSSVDTYIQRVREARTNPSPAEDEAKHRALSEAITKDDEANGPNSRDMEARLAAIEDSTLRQTGWTAKHRWLIWTLGVSGGLLSGVTTELIGLNFGPAITTFLTNNALLLWEVALTYGPTFAGWFGAVMGPIFLALGIEEEMVKRMDKGNKPKYKP